MDAVALSPEVETLLKEARRCGRHWDDHYCPNCDRSFNDITRPLEDALRASETARQQLEAKLAVTEQIVHPECDECHRPIYNGEHSVPANSQEAGDFHAICHVRRLETAKQQAEQARDWMDCHVPQVEAERDQFKARAEQAEQDREGLKLLAAEILNTWGVFARRGKEQDAIYSLRKRLESDQPSSVGAVDGSGDRRK